MAGYSRRLNSGSQTGPWPCKGTCPVMSGQSPTTAQYANKPMPSYCCWERRHVCIVRIWTVSKMAIDWIQPASSSSAPRYLYIGVMYVHMYIRTFPMLACWLAGCGARSIKASKPQRLSHGLIGWLSRQTSSSAAFCGAVPESAHGFIMQRPEINLMR